MKSKERIFKRYLEKEYGDGREVKGDYEYRISFCDKINMENEIIIFKVIMKKV